MAGPGLSLVAALLTLAGSEWGVDGHEAAFVQFQTDKVSGHGGCNRFGGPYTFDGTAIKIGPLFATRMACAQDVMERESRFLGLFERARAAEASHLTLILKDEKGEVIATLKRRDFD